MLNPVVMRTPNLSSAATTTMALTDELEGDEKFPSVGWEVNPRVDPDCADHEKNVLVRSYFGPLKQLSLRGQICAKSGVSLCAKISLRPT